MTSKYVDSLPLYRQEAMFERHGVRLHRATQAAYLRRLFAELPKAKTVEDFEAMLPFNSEAYAFSSSDALASRNPMDG